MVLVVANYSELLPPQASWMQGEKFDGKDLPKYIERESKEGKY
jgi:hypothetical protein